MFLINLQRLEPFQSTALLRPFDDSSKYRVLTVQMRRRRITYEELTPICVRALVSHANYAARIVAQGGLYFIFEECAIDGRAWIGFWIKRRIWIVGGRMVRSASLHDEGGNGAVDRRVVVVSGGAEGEEVISGFGRRFAEDLELEITEVRMELVKGTER